jgi:RecA/RadA recombinase
MDSKILLLNEWTTVSERRASGRVSVKKIEKDEKKKTITGKLAKQSGEKYDPTLNWENGEVTCGCGTAGQKGLLFCRHLIAVFDTLCSGKRTEKYAKMFLAVLNSRKDYTSYKTPSERMETGCELIDKLLMGGFPKSVITVIAGPTKVGKSWLASQATFRNALKDKNILYIDTEGYYLDKEVLPKMAGYFKKRWGVEDKEVKVNFLFPKDIGELAGYFGLAMAMTRKGGKPTPTIYSNVGRDVTPIYGICEEKNIDMIVIDSLTAIFKKGIVSSQTQALPARSDMINALYARLEEIARDLGVAVIMTAHASRNYDFDVNDLLTGKSESGGGIWGGYSLMFNVKYLIQIEYIDTDDDDNKIHRGRATRYIIRRLWPAMYPRYVIAELLQDYGYEKFDLSGKIVPQDLDTRIRDLEEKIVEFTDDVEDAKVMVKDKKKSED